MKSSNIIFNSLLNSEEEITIEWINSLANPYDTLDSLADVINSGVLGSDKSAEANTNNIVVADAGKTIEINFYMIVASGEVPILTIYDEPNTFSHQFGLSDAGDGIYYLDWEQYGIPIESSETVKFSLTNTHATNFSVSYLTII